jgi:uncharacterized protein
VTAPAPWTPVAGRERYAVIDVIRGTALFGVLLVNLLTGFRVSLFDYILRFHTHPGTLNHVVDNAVAGAVEFKAFALFSLLFGAGAAIQRERTSPVLLARRFGVLLVFGLCHMLLIWNGDILTLYAVCGFLILPFLGLSARMLALAGGLVILLSSLVQIPVPWPSEEAMRANAANAQLVYAQGSFLEVLRFRIAETVPFFVPLWVGSLLSTAGLMLWGAAAWKLGLLRSPSAYRRELRFALILCGIAGGLLTAVEVAAHASHAPALLPGWLLEPAGHILLALAYAAAILLWTPFGRTTGFARYLAAAGQMAFTNYIVQSIVLGWIFYGYGLGLFGRLGSAPATLIAFALYAVQLIASRLWLSRCRFGPLEWLWRTLTYGKIQGMRRAELQ